MKLLPLLQIGISRTFCFLNSTLGKLLMLFSHALCNQVGKLLSLRFCEL